MLAHEIESFLGYTMLSGIGGTLWQEMHASIHFDLHIKMCQPSFIGNEHSFIESLSYMLSDDLMGFESTRHVFNGDQLGTEQ